MSKNRTSKSEPPQSMTALQGKEIWRYRDLLDLLSYSLFQKQKSNPEHLESIPVLMHEARLQSVKGIISAALPERCKQQHKLDLYQEVSNNLQICYNHSLLQTWLRDVPYVILKGCASAYYYPNPMLRSMGDVDFLVPPAYISAAGKAMEAQGLKPWKNDHPSHIVYSGGNGMRYEMHFRVAGIPDGDTGEKLTAYFSDVFDKAAERTVGAHQMMLPSPFHHGLVLLLHTIHHLTGEGIGIRHLRAVACL